MFNYSLIKRSSLVIYFLNIIVRPIRKPYQIARFNNIIPILSNYKEITWHAAGRVIFVVSILRNYKQNM